MTGTPIELGAVVGLAFGLIKLIEHLVNRFTAKKDNNGDISMSKILSQLELMNSNHLNHIEGAINNGNDKIVNAIQNMHLDLVKELNRKNQ